MGRGDRDNCELDVLGPPKTLTGVVLAKVVLEVDGVNALQVVLPRKTMAEHEINRIVRRDALVFSMRWS